MARQPKLKVFRTAIGFHDAYVAAPSRKAALAAWGADADLFARGVAEQVTDAELSREPLAHPGQVIRRLRGTAEEQLAALPPDRPRPAPKERATTQATPEPKTKPKPKPKPRPSREQLDAAEAMLAELLHHQQAEREELRARQDAERRRLADAQDRARADAEQALERERERHADQLARWNRDRD